MAKIQINGTTYEVRPGRNLLQTCIGLGFDIPYFCYHPALGSVGACRLCAVKKFANPDDKKGKIVMSCMEPIADGLIISVDHPEVIEFRAAVIEGLMTNHPHDCPVCDEGGECHLQDMTTMAGHNYRKFIFNKRTYKNQNLGPFIQHEMNRCIQCYRCVRFYKDYAGGKDLNVFGTANHVYFGRDQEGTLESEFSGNLVEVCPTGVFTDKTLKSHFTRKWDMTHSPSVCVHCSLGCNTILSERYGTVRRTMSRYNSSINGYFLCDRGRFGYEFLNDPRRIRKIMVRSSKNSNPQEVESLAQIDLFSGPEGTSRIMGIGSPRASLESNYVLSAFVGEENFFHGISGKEHALVKKALQMLESSNARIPSLKEAEKYDSVILLGEDVTNTAPMLALSIRQAVRNKSIAMAEKRGIPGWNDAAVRVLNHETRSPVFIASPYSTRLDDIAEGTWQSAPDDIARLGFEIASAVHSDAPSIPLPGKLLQETAGRIAEALLGAENPLIVTGISLGSMAILEAAENLVTALSLRGKKPGLVVVLPESNSAGLGITEGNHLDGALETISNKQIDTLVILENDLFRRIGTEQAGRFFEKCRKVIVVDHTMHETAKRADVLLPAAPYAESAGTLINNEGRAQRYYPAMPIQGSLKESWNWITELMKMTGRDREFAWKSFDQIVASLANRYPLLSGIKENMPDAGFRFFNEKIARQTLRFSGRTAITANVSVSEQQPPNDPDSPLNFSMEGYKGFPPPSLNPYYWSPGWNSPQAINKYLEEPDGAMKSEESGVLIFPKAGNTGSAFRTNIPGPFTERPGELFFTPLHRIFGSEELSSNGKAIMERIQKPFVLLNKKEAEKLNIIENVNYKVNLDQVSVDVVISTDDHVPDGVAGLSLLFPGMPFVNAPGWGKIVPARSV